MEWKHLRLLFLYLSILTIHSTSTSAFSLNDALDQLLTSYPLSLLQAQEPVPAHQDSSTSPRENAPLEAATFPCCNCGGCICSHTSCPEIRPEPEPSAPKPSPPEASWRPISTGAPELISTAGCGAKYSPDACLTFVQQYLQALQPALEVAGKHPHSHDAQVDSQGKHKKDKKKKQPCCGEGCSDVQCLRYLATAVKDLQAPINGTLESSKHQDDATIAAKEARAAKSEELKAEL